MTETTEDNDTPEQKRIPTTRTLRGDDQIRSAPEQEKLRQRVTALEDASDETDALVIELLERVEMLEARVAALEEPKRTNARVMLPENWNSNSTDDLMTGEAAPNVTDKIDQLAGGPQR